MNLATNIRSATTLVAAKFATLIERAALTPHDVEQFESHKVTIIRALKARLDCVESVLIGSFARNTAIHGPSDVDVLLVLKKRSLTWGSTLKSSTTVLAEVRSALQERYPSTGVGRDGQAVVVNFRDGAHPVDVVPAYYMEQGGDYNYPVYGIPNGQGGWMRTSPQSHNRFIALADGRAGGKLKYASKLFKYWRETRAVPVPISGFHVELLLAEQRTCEGALGYATIFRNLLVALANRQCRSLQDPVKVSGLIAAAATEAKRAQALCTVVESAHRADAALQAERRGNAQEALRLWRLVFNGEFPA